MISLTTLGARETSQKLLGVASRMADQQPAWTILRGALMDVEKKFWASGDGDGEWRPNMRSTIERDKRGGRNPALMVNTGKLRAASTNQGASGQTLLAGPDFLRLTLNLPVAGYMGASGRSPLRPPNSAELHAMDTVLVRYMLTGGR